jgi:hypothetical protein
MRLDSSGNLGLGVIPSAWASGYRVFDIGNAALHYPNSASQVGVSANAYFGGSGWVYKASANATLALQNAGQHIWYTSASGTAGNTISFTQAMTLDAAGRLALGTTTILGTSNRACFANDTSAKGVLALQSTSTSGYSAIELYDNSGSQQGAVGWGNASVAVTGAASATYLYSTGAITFLSGGTTERARFTAAGLFGLGVTSPQAMFDLAGDYKEGVVTANTGTAYTINTATGTVQILTLTGNCTFTFPTAVAGESFTLLLRQDGTGSRTVTWPSAVRWPGGTAPTITATANQTDKYVFTSDGTRWYGSNAGQAYAA